MRLLRRYEINQKNEIIQAPRNDVEKKLPAMTYVNEIASSLWD
jgi:hypothetical protein